MIFFFFFFFRHSFSFSDVLCQIFFLSSCFRKWGQKPPQGQSLPLIPGAWLLHLQQLIWNLLFIGSFDQVNLYKCLYSIVRQSRKKTHFCCNLFSYGIYFNEISDNQLHKGTQKKKKRFTIKFRLCDDKHSFLATNILESASQS